MNMLELRKVTAGYGHFTALWDVDLTVAPGEAVAVVGPNGAGKTTLMRVISGLVPARAGHLAFEGASLDGTPAHEIVAHGIAHVPEGRRIFGELTVEENLRAGAITVKSGEARHRAYERVFTAFPVLAERRNQLAGTLSGGEQQMLAIGRALMSRPALLLFDEPSLGIAPIVVEAIGRMIARIRDEGTTVLLVEQNASLALRLADRAYVLETGRVTLQGPTKELTANPEVHRAYLGG